MSLKSSNKNCLVDSGYSVLDFETKDKKVYSNSGKIIFQKGDFVLKEIVRISFLNQHLKEFHRDSELLKNEFNCLKDIYQ